MVRDVEERARKIVTQMIGDIQRSLMPLPRGRVEITYQDTKWAQAIAALCVEYAREQVESLAESRAVLADRLTAARERETALREALTRSDSYLSLLRHRASHLIPWGEPGLPASHEVDSVIGQSRKALTERP